MFWARLSSIPDGLSGAEAAERLQRYGANEVSGDSRSFWSIVRDQHRSGISILLETRPTNRLQRALAEARVGREQPPCRRDAGRHPGLKKGL